MSWYPPPKSLLFIFFFFQRWDYNKQQKMYHKMCHCRSVTMAFYEDESCVNMKHWPLRAVQSIAKVYMLYTTSLSHCPELLHLISTQNYYNVSGQLTSILINLHRTPKLIFTYYLGVVVRTVFSVHNTLPDTYPNTHTLTHTNKQLSMSVSVMRQLEAVLIEQCPSHWPSMVKA